MSDIPEDVREAVVRAIAHTELSAWGMPADKIPRLSSDYASHADAALAALRAAGYEVRKGWQPIETAPKDGERVLLYSDGKNGSKQAIQTASWQQINWHRDGGFWEESHCYDDGFCVALNFTHWMPLPPPPQVKP